MKKLIFLLALTIGFAFTVCSQGSRVETMTLTAQTLVGNTGANDTLFIYSPYLGDYWDYSIQFKATWAGELAFSADSCSVNVRTYQTNDPDKSTWIDIPAERDTLQTIIDDESMIIEISDFQGLWLKHQILNMGYDTVTITPYVVKKLKRTIE